MTEDERCSILLEAKEKPDGVIFMGGAYGLSDDEMRRRKHIRFLSDDGYLEKMNDQAYRLTAKGDAAAEECADKSKLKRVIKWARNTRAWKELWAVLLVLLGRG